MQRKTGLDAALYFHFPCFDGIISAVLALDYLEGQGWKFTSLHPVGYALRESWLSMKLAPLSGVVDFLYHPDAQFWADHHPTTFLTGRARIGFEESNSAWNFYDSTSNSCASLLWRFLSGDLARGHDRFEEMVRWADKIDSARYDSVEEAIFGDSPALRVSLSLVRGDAVYARYLVKALRVETLAAVADSPRVSKRFEQVRSGVLVGLERFREAATLESDDIVVFDLRASGKDIISRYAPFYFFPQARYSVGVIRHSDRAKITAMRNPWREFQSASLGAIFARHGGGGHERVGSLILRRQHAEDAGSLLRELLSEIRKEDAGVLVSSRAFR